VAVTASEPRLLERDAELGHLRGRFLAASLRRPFLKALRPKDAKGVPDAGSRAHAQTRL
jgi:hypothetical protein